MLKEANFHRLTLTSPCNEKILWIGRRKREDMKLKGQILSFGRGFLPVVDPGVFFLKFFEASVRNDSAASLPRVKRVTLRTYSHPNLFLRGAGHKGITAGTVYFAFLISRMDFFFHGRKHLSFKKT
jgi:hypothetical protein